MVASEKELMRGLRGIANAASGSLVKLNGNADVPVDRGQLASETYIGSSSFALASGRVCSGHALRQLNLRRS